MFHATISYNFVIILPVKWTGAATRAINDLVLAKSYPASNAQASLVVASHEDEEMHCS